MPNGYKDRLNEAVRLAECDVYRNQEVMEEMYHSFRKDGERADQKIDNYIKQNRREMVIAATSSQRGEVQDKIINNFL